MRPDRDPQRLFRQEANELLEALSNELLRPTSDPEATARMMRLAHTLKGAAHVVGHDAISDLAHLMEDVLAEHREAQTELSQQERTEILQIVTTLRGQVTQLGNNAGPERGGQPAGKSLAAPDLDVVRIDLSELDSLTQAVAAAEMQGNAGSSREVEAMVRSAESVASRTEIAARAAGGPRSIEVDTALRAARDLAHEVMRFRHEAAMRSDLLARALRTVRDCSEALRLVPASVVFPALEQGAKAACHSAGRDVRILLDGGDVRLDRRVLQPLREALLHLVRNAVDHGIELADERLAAGKPETGTVRVRVERRADRVVVTCEDDGRGVDREDVRRAAVRLGLVSEGEAAGLSEHALLLLLLRPGMTTARGVTELSGRGVGLDVVRAAATRMRGDVEISTVPGKGTAVALVVPVSLSTVMVLELVMEAAVALIPLDSVETIFRVRREELVADAAGVRVAYGGQLVAFVPLSSLMNRAEDAWSAERPCSVIIVRASGERAAIGLDRVVGIHESIVHPLPAAIPPNGLVLGAVLDAEGRGSLVLNPAGIVAATRGRGWTFSSAALAQARKRPILVIDDSLTTRVLEQSILEASGYQVHLASSAEEALSLTESHDYGLFVVDVEMPGMNGFEFVAHTRADPRLREVPAIVVTSLSSPEQRKRGEQVGAAAYVVKSEFDQGRFLDRVVELAK